MSKDRGQKKKKKTENDNENIGCDDREIANEKKDLLMEIASLKLSIVEACSRDTTKFGNICKPQIDDRAKISGHIGQLIDVNVTFKNELCLYTGMCCKKPGPEFIFAFQSIKKNVCSNNYWVQLSKIEENWQLKKWVMPPSVDVKTIAEKCLITSAGSMKLFLIECKHHIDCYNRRAQQCKELEDFVVNLERVSCVVEPNYGYTRIVIKLIKFRREYPEEAKNILIYLSYKPHETRPWKLVFDCEEDNELSDDETINLRRLFRKLKEQDLTVTMKTVLTSEESPFTWNKTDKDDDGIDTSEDDTEEETSLRELLRKKSKLGKKRSKVVTESDENQKEITRDDDELENELSDEYASPLSPQSGEEDGLQHRTKKNINKKTSKKSLSKDEAKTTAKDKRKTSKVSKKKSPKCKKINTDSATNIVGSSKKVVLNENSAKTVKAKKTVPEIFKGRTVVRTEPLLINEEAPSALLKSKNDGIENSAKTVKAKKTVPEIFQGRTVATIESLQINEEASSALLKSKKDENKNSAKPVKAKKTVPEIFKGRTVATPELSQENEKAASPLQESPSSKTRTGRKRSTKTKARDFRKILCSTRINEDNPRLSIVEEENISAISREPDVAGIEENNDITDEQSHRVLLKDLRNLKHSILETKQPAKRKAESSVSGRKKKVPRK